MHSLTLQEHWERRRPRRRCSRNLNGVLTAFALIGLTWCEESGRAAVPFVLQGPGVNPAHFRVTEFATGLNYPVGMAEMTDGSILVTSTDGPNYFSSNARLLRFRDANQDGVADGPPTVLFNGLSGGITSVRMGGSLVFVAGQSRPIYVLRMGATPADPFSEIGRMMITYPSGGWLHPHSALAVRPTPGRARSYDLFFQVGSQANFATTTKTASLSSTGLGGFAGVLSGDSIYQLTFVDEGAAVVVTNLLQIATGLRNPSGFAFHPATGDLYFEDNGIDGLVNSNEPHSADELNVLPASALGDSSGAGAPFYGFPTNYTAYRTETVVGGQGIQPFVAFQPLPNPLTGAESEGPNDIAFSPPVFPPSLDGGVFVTFHGRFQSGGTNNEENPLVFVDLRTTNYFHVIAGRLPGVGHLDGLLSTRDSLFVSDISTNGSLSAAAGRGVVYQIKALVGPPVSARWVGSQIEIDWTEGMLQSSSNLSDGWIDVTNVSPFRTDPTEFRSFFRTRN